MPDRSGMKSYLQQAAAWTGVLKWIRAIVTKEEISDSRMGDLPSPRQEAAGDVVIRDDGCEIRHK